MADIRQQIPDEAIKAGSTAAVAADPSLVVAFSPNSPLPTGTNAIGTVAVTSTQDAIGSGTITAADIVVAAPAGAGVLVSGASTAGSYVSLACPGGDSGWIIQMLGTFGGSTLYFEESVDSTNGIDGNWTNVNGRQTGVVNTVLGSSATSPGFYRGNTSGVKFIRVRAVGGSAISITVVIRLSSGAGAIFLNASIPAGGNTIGTVNIQGLGLTGTSASIAAAGTGTAGPLAVGTAGNCTFTIKNTVSASPYAGNPVVVFEQSDNNVDWGPLMVVRNDTYAAQTTVTLVPNTAATELTFDAALEGVNYVRARVTTGPVTNAMTIAIAAGGLPFVNVVSAVQQPLTKGTQGISGVTTQDLKDAGRVSVAITAYQAVGIITTEALFAAASFANTRDGGTPTTGIQFTVSAGKRLRIQSIECSIKNNAAAAGTSKLALRYSGVGGTITNASPVLALWDLGSNNAVAGNYIGPMVLPLPDGLELIPNSTFGFTNLSSAVTMLHTITVNGYEY